MIKKTALEQLIQQCGLSVFPEKGSKNIGVEALLTILAYEGLKWAIPELKEWIRLGAEAISVARLQIRKKLIDFAIQKELDFPAAERAANLIADHINEKNAKEIIQTLE
jgi:hypothetical protein